MEDGCEIQLLNFAKVYDVLAGASQRVSCIVLAMPSTLREAMQAELKGCGLNEAVVPSKISCELAFTMPSARSEATPSHSP